MALTQKTQKEKNQNSKRETRKKARKALPFVDFDSVNTSYYRPVEDLYMKEAQAIARSWEQYDNEWN
jgi:hypothetical protein